MTAHAKRSGRSLTQEVTKRLDDSFAIKAEPDPFLRAILYLIGQAALFTGKEWKTDPWMFQVFRAVVSFILENLPRQENSYPPKRRRKSERKWVSRPTS